MFFHRKSILNWYLFLLITTLLLLHGSLSGTIQPDIVYRRDGDILLGGLFPLHIYDESIRYCSDIRDLSSLKNLEGMVYAIDDINRHETLLPNITIGFEIYDSCFDFAVTVARCLNFLKKKRENDCLWKIPDDVCRRTSDGGPLVGVVGAQRSVCTMEAAMLLATDAIPVISYLSTSDELSNRFKYPYFMRTVPPDTPEVSSYWDDEDFDKLVKTLRQDPYSRARVSVLFMYVEQARKLMQAVQRAGAEVEFTWVVSDGITVDGVRALSGLENVAAGTLAVIPFSNRLEEFDLQFYTKDYHVDPNPWGVEFENYYCASHLFCQSNYTDTLSDYSTTDTLVMDGVYAFGYALHDLYYTLCHNGSDPKLCLQTIATNGTLLYSYLRDVKFISLANGYVTFNDNGDAEGKYAIENYQLDGDGILRRLRVGTWTELRPEAVRLMIEDDLIEFNSNLSLSAESSTPVSVCSQPCDIGLVKSFFTEKLCCWECKECLDNETVLNSTSCSPCPPETSPNMNKTHCGLQSRSSGDSGGLGWTMTFIGCLGFLVELIHITLLLYKRNNVVVKTMEPVLTVSILVGIALTFISTAMHSLTPVTAVCYVLRMGPGVSLVLIYVPLAIKTVRSYRIFKAAKKTGSQREAELWNNKRHIILISLAVIAQLDLRCPSLYRLCCGIDRSFDHLCRLVSNYSTDYHRSIFYSEEGGVYHHDACAVPYFQPISDILFNAIFLTIGCIFSILAHALPDNNYEIRLLAFSLFGTAILFFSVTVPYFTSPTAYRSLLYIAIGLNLMESSLWSVCSLLGCTLLVLALREQRMMSQPRNRLVVVCKESTDLG
ncbi:putative metabotropic glutamate receptor 3 [Apostichopus japonicus]|uniref:Putative metabotropic glutamate receptor 3 n=1 Tax=Stichopus japonicus TaxID=307972 RepID=A0A2G8K8D9_STIJA|nr:putative metabotropic glutamate receptor 3 [Apostichopus japonicus]